MKAVMSALGLLAHSCYTNAGYVATIDIASCADLLTAADALSGGDIEANIVEADIACDEWTTVEVGQNKLKFVGSGATFTSARFVVAAGAVLRADVPLVFMGDQTQTVNGGLLNVADGGKARFLDSVAMNDVGVLSVSEEAMVHGGCVYNEGLIRFEGTFSADGCKTVSSDTASVIPGNGGGLWNGPGGKIVFKEAVEMKNCGERTGLKNWSSEGLDGGAIYTDGKVSFYEDAQFTDNEADEGGAICIGVDGELKFLKRAKVTFTGNNSEGSGGHINNDGTLVLRNTGVFSDGYAGGSGGAIYAGSFSSMLFVKHVDFLDNTAGAHGGAIATNYPNIDDLPEDATYEGNSRTNADFDFECNNVYVNGDAGGGEDGYICIPGGAGSSYTI
ncbi:unnamed protein product [Ectocarpus sp. 12 AP-2014]